MWNLKNQNPEKETKFIDPESRLLAVRGWGWGGQEWQNGWKGRQRNSYKGNKSHGCNIQHGNCSWYCIVYLKFAKRVGLKSFCHKKKMWWIDINIKLCFIHETNYSLMLKNAIANTCHQMINLSVCSALKRFKKKSSCYIS